MPKIEALIQKKLSEIINQNFSDNVDYVSINYVQTTKDLNYTKVFVSFLSKNPQKNFTKLNKIRNKIQKSFGDNINLRKTPKIEFVLDLKLDDIIKVESILDKISDDHEN